MLKSNTIIENPCTDCNDQIPCEICTAKKTYKVKIIGQIELLKFLTKSNKGLTHIYYPDELKTILRILKKLIDK
jgi:hypothetical protein